VEVVVYCWIRCEKCFAFDFVMLVLIQGSAGSQSDTFD
jgi:hypothetical protein